MAGRIYARNRLKRIEYSFALTNFSMSFHKLPGIITNMYYLYSQSNPKHSGLKLIQDEPYFQLSVSLFPRKPEIPTCLLVVESP